MTKIKFFKDKDIIAKVECLGHTGFDEFGKDVLCASISALVQACYLGLKDVLDIELKLVRKDGYLSFELPKNLQIEILKNAQVLLKTLEISIKDLCDGYSKYISMEVVEYVY